MLFVLSLIFTFGSFLVIFVYSILNSVSFFMSVLYGLIGFVSFLAFFCILILLILVILWEHLAKTDKPFSKFRWYLARDIAMYSVFWLHVRVRKYGFEKIPKDRPIIIYANHQNFLDMFIFYQVLKDFPHATLYKKEILKYPLVRGVGKGLGGVAIDRTDDRSAAKSVIEVIRRIKNGQTFLIFPEGTRTKNAELNEYKAGSFKIAQKTDTDLVVMVIDNAYKITHRMVYQKTIVDVTIAGVIPHADLPENTHDIAKMVYNIANETLQKGRKNKKYLRKPKKFLTDNHNELE